MLMTSYARKKRKACDDLAVSYKPSGRHKVWELRSRYSHRKHAASYIYIYIYIYVTMELLIWIDFIANMDK